MNTAAHTLLLSRTKIAELATTSDYLAAMRTAFADLAKQRYVLPNVGHIPAARGVFHIKAAMRQGSASLAVIKVNGNFPGNPLELGLPTIQGFIALLDAERGSVLALMDSTEITARRTAAATALATEYLAQSGSSILGIVGCGIQARYHVDALLDVAPIKSVKYCDPRDEAADAFATHTANLGITAKRVCEARDVARGADIVVTVTTSTRPVLELADIEPGTFVAGVGADNPSKHELAADLLRGSQVIVDLLTQSSTMGDLHHAIRLGAMAHTDVHGELADLVAGRIAGRTDNHGRFVFDSTGIALQDLAAAEMVYERARRHGEVLAFDLNGAGTAGFR